MFQSKIINAYLFDPKIDRSVDRSKYNFDFFLLFGIRYFHFKNSIEHSGSFNILQMFQSKIINAYLFDPKIDRSVDRNKYNFDFFSLFGIRHFRFKNSTEHSGSFNVLYSEHRYNGRMDRN